MASSTLGDSGIVTELAPVLPQKCYYSEFAYTKNVCLNCHKKKSPVGFAARECIPQVPLSKSQLKRRNRKKNKQRTTEPDEDLKRECREAKHYVPVCKPNYAGYDQVQQRRRQQIQEHEAHKDKDARDKMIELDFLMNFLNTSNKNMRAIEEGRQLKAFLTNLAPDAYQLPDAEWLDLTRGDIATGWLYNITAAQVELISATPLRGKMMYILLKNVFDGDDTKLWEFIRKLAENVKKFTPPILFETFSYPLLEKYKEVKPYAVLKFLRVLLKGEEQKYHELFAC